MLLQEVLTKLASLDADLSEKRAKKAQLEADVHMCTVKLDRAQKLIAGLGGEKSRWTAVAARLGQQFIALTGDIVLAAAQIAYLGGDQPLPHGCSQCRATFSLPTISSSSI